MARAVLIDTCTAIWLMFGDPLSDDSRRAMEDARSHNMGIYVSPITAWEIGNLLAKGRLQLILSPEAWFDRLLAQPGIRLADMSPRVLIASTTLPGSPPRDPADRIIAATCRQTGFLLITRDAKLLNYAGAGHLQAIDC